MIKQMELMEYATRGAIKESDEELEKEISEL